MDSVVDTESFRSYVAQVLGPTLVPGDIVVLDNLAVHKVVGIAETLRTRPLLADIYGWFTMGFDTPVRAQYALHGRVREQPQEYWHGSARLQTRNVKLSI